MIKNLFDLVVAMGYQPDLSPYVYSLELGLDSPHRDDDESEVCFPLYANLRDEDGDEDSFQLFTVSQSDIDTLGLSTPYTVTKEDLLGIWDEMDAVFSGDWEGSKDEFGVR